jgi:serine/threonine protein kinase
MTTTPACPRCGAPLAARTTPGGLCARCLLAAAKDEPASGPAPVEEAPRPPTPEELAPHFPGLAIEALIGRGGMGAVYRARQSALERTVALKVLHAHVAERSGFAERFGREARTLARLDHENLVTVHEFGQAGPWFYFVMEFVDGVGLRQMLEARSVSPREALGLVAQICDALQYAHDQGVVHRDIKPENILVDRRGRVRILDFGLSKLVGLEGRGLTHSHQVMGTPQYMAPEQWSSPLEVDHRADIYSLGVVFYELLTGELPVGPYQAPSRRVAVDVRLDEVVLRTLEREPQQRFQRASEVKTRVETIASTPSAPVSHGRARRRHGSWPLVLVGVALVAFLLAVFALFFLVQGGRIVPSTPPPPAFETPHVPQDPDPVDPGD